MSRSPSRRTSRLALLAGMVLPWLWFPVRDSHPWLDVIAIGWPVIATAIVVLLAVGGLLARRTGPLLVAVSVVAASLVVVVGPWTPQAAGTPADPLRVVAANTATYESDPEGVLAAIDAQAPDVLVVSEASTPLHDMLRARFRHTVGPRGPHRTGDVSVYSDLPLQPSSLEDGLRNQRGVRIEVDAPAGTVALYALHLQRPNAAPEGRGQAGFRTHRRIVDALEAAVVAESLPVIVAGDLNLSDRTSGYRLLTGPLRDAVRSGWVGPTSLVPRTEVLFARIDHVLVSRSWCADDGVVFDLPGSDHRGVAATVGPCA